VSVWSWLKLAAGLWLLRKTAKGAGWLLLAAVLVAAWPLTLIIAARVRHRVVARLPARLAAPRRRLVPDRARRLAGRRGTARQ
jgi:hypothetical protein